MAHRNEEAAKRSLHGKPTELPSEEVGAGFRGTLQPAPDGIVIVDCNGRIALINSQTEKMFGYNRDELLGKPVEVLLPEYLREVHVAHRGKYYSRPHSRQMGRGLDLYARRKDGSLFPVEVSLSFLERKEGLLVTATIRDISERKRLASELSTLYALLGPISQASELKGVLQDAVVKIMEITGAEAGSIRLLDGKGDRLVLAAHRGFPESYTHEISIGKVSRHILRTGETIISEELFNDLRFNRRLLAKHGFGSAAYLPLKGSQKVCGIMVLASREARRINQGQGGLFTAISHQVSVALENAQLYEEVKKNNFDLEKANREINRANLHLARLLEEQRALGETLTQLNVLDMGELLKKITERSRHLLKADHVQLRLLDKGGLLSIAAAAGKGAERFADRFNPGSGRSSWAMKHQQPLAVKDISQDTIFGPGHALRAMGVKGYLVIPLISRARESIGVLCFSSVTEREFTQEEIALAEQLASGAASAVENANLFAEVKKKAFELEKTNTDLQEASQAKSKFMASMSHELRTPLNVIIGNTNLVKESFFGDINENQANALGKVVRYSKVLLQLIDDVLTLTKADAKKLTAENSTVDLQEVMSGLHPYIDQLNRDNRLEVSWEVEENLPPITTDALKLEEILQNLVGNAFKYTPQGRVEIRVKNIPSKERVEFAVADTGMGIQTEDLQQIFEEFHQLDEAHTGKYNGVGLGLSIVKRYLELMRGDIRVDSQPGKGSTFTFTLPYSPTTSPERADT